MCKRLPCTSNVIIRYKYMGNEFHYPRTFQKCKQQHGRRAYVCRTGTMTPTQNQYGHLLLATIGRSRCQSASSCKTIHKSRSQWSTLQNMKYYIIWTLRNNNVIKWRLNIFPLVFNSMLYGGALYIFQIHQGTKHIILWEIGSNTKYGFNKREYPMVTAGRM